MKETLISFETAKLAKKKGFGWFGFGEGEKFYYPPTKELTRNHRGENYPAPTQSLLQKWLREVHKIHICDEVRWNNFEKQELIYEFWIKDMREVKASKRIYTCPSTISYEEALEEALQKALKLIK